MQDDNEEQTDSDLRGCQARDLREVCFICNEPDEKLKVLSNATWRTVNKASESRREWSSDIYSSVTERVQKCVDFQQLKYHSVCYKKFTAVKKRPCNALVTESPESTTVSTRSSTNMLRTGERGLLADACVFCGLSRKKRNGVEEKLSLVMTKEGADLIKEAILKRKDPLLLPIIETGGDLIAKEAKYHKSCRRTYVRELEHNEDPRSSATCRSVHADTFKSLKEFVELEILQKGGSYLMSTLYKHYENEFLCLGGTNDDFESYSKFLLLAKIKKEFHDEIKVELLNNRDGNFVFKSSMKREDALIALHNDRTTAKEDELIRSAALHLRSIILAMPKTSSPSNMTAQTLKATSAEIPGQLNLFFQTLYHGLKPLKDNDSVERKMIASSSDAIYNTTKGSVVPWKQISLGLGLSTLTGSKQVLRILNRCGHTVSYDNAKAMETEFAYSSTSNNRLSPDGLILQEKLATATAWDNFDVNIETTDGKDTLHCTVGICYQNRSQLCPDSSSTSLEMRSGRKRKSFHHDDDELPQCYSTMKRARFDLSFSNSDDNDQSTRPIDFWWLLESQRNELPLLPGYLTKFMKDNLPVQVITYLEPLMSSPTVNKVVKETMIRALAIAKEMQEEYAIVTYDLAVASKAYCIQQLEAPMFDKLLVLLGNFHVEIAFFGALGTFIQESGVEVILTESNVLSAGSLNGFMKGKYFNRCTRIHQILATVLEKLLYQAFLETMTDEERDEISIVMNGAPESEEFLLEYLENNVEFCRHLSSFETYFNRTIRGDFGPTAAYWATYVYFMNRIFRNLQRAVRTNDVDLYVETFPFVLDMFFALNRPNYARWGSLFLDKLKNLPPSCRESLRMGAFSIRRTSKDFSRSSVDLTLEQTINRDASSCLRGIVAFRNSESAVKRWAVTTAQRGMIVSDLKSFVGLESIEQPATQARKWRIRKDNADSNSVKEAIQQSCNPFDNSANP